jgi:hypothetical protein
MYNFVEDKLAEVPNIIQESVLIEFSILNRDRRELHQKEFKMMV